MNTKGRLANLCFKLVSLSVYYDIDNKELYVYDDENKITTKYWPVNETLAIIILSGDYDILETTIKNSKYKIVAKPRNVVWTKVTKEINTTIYKVDSSNVEYVGFDKPSHKLYVKYKSSSDIYEYSNIDESIFNGIMNAESLGSFLHWFIKINKGSYPYRKISSSNVTISSIPLGNAGTAHPNGYMTDKNW